MGMFDSVFVTCPHCNKGRIEFQSKVGNCGLHEYTLNNCPASIAEDLNGEIEKCPKCSHTIEFKARTIAQCWVE